MKYVCEFLRQACYHLEVKNFPTATDSSKIMIQSVIATIRRKNWLSTPLTGDQHPQKVRTVQSLGQRSKIKGSIQIQEVHVGLHSNA